MIAVYLLLTIPVLAGLALIIDGARRVVQELKKTKPDLQA